MGSWGVGTSVGCGGGDAESLEVGFGGGSAKSKWTGWLPGTLQSSETTEPTFRNWSQIHQLPSGAPSRGFDPNFCLHIRLHLLDANLINACSKSCLALPSGQIKIISTAVTIKETRNNLRMAELTYATGTR